MDISAFAIVLAVLSLPGLTSIVIINHLTVYQTRTPFFFIVFAFILGVVNYLIFSVLYLLILSLGCNPFGIFDGRLDVWTILLTERSDTLPFLEIIGAWFVSVITGCILTAALSNTVFLRLATALKLTKKAGDDDIWFYFVNAEETTWVYVRDYKNELTYFGAVRAYSEPFTEREIVLSDVSVYRTNNRREKDTTPLYEVPSVYLSLEKGMFTIEHAIQD